MSGDQPDDVDQQTQLLMGIAAELTAIRRLLEAQQATADETTDDSGPVAHCHCGATFDDVDEAKRHDRDRHNAPRGDELTTWPEA